MLKKIFGVKSRPVPPANHLSIGDVQFILGAPKQGASETRAVGNPGDRDYATYTMDNLVDGRTFSLHALIRADGNDYRTEIKAEKLNDQVLRIDSLVFDNKTERLDNAKEIYNVLNYIGNNHVRHVFFSQAQRKNSIPGPHEEKGEFGNLGRFLTRHLPKPKSDGFWG